MALNDIFRLAVVGQGPQGQELVNVHYYRQNTTDPNNDGTPLGFGWVAQVAPLYALCISNTTSILRLQIRNVTQPTFGIDYTTGLPIAGLLAGEALPPQTAFIVSWRTGLIGRSRRGRTFVWPPNEASQASGQLSGGYLAALNNFATQSLTVTGAGGAPVYLKVVFSEVLTQAFTINSFTVPQFSGSQRRRRTGSGS